jgi:Patatin
MSENTILQGQDKHSTIDLNVSLIDGFLRFRVPVTLCIDHLRELVLLYNHPCKGDTLSEFANEAKELHKPRTLAYKENQYVKAKSMQGKIGPIMEPESPLEIDEEEDRIHQMYDIFVDYDDTIIVSEKPSTSIVHCNTFTISQIDKEDNSNTEDEERFLYKGQILEFVKTLADYSLPNPVTLSYGKPFKVTFRHPNDKEDATFYACDERVATELKEILSKMGWLDYHSKPSAIESEIQSTAASLKDSNSNPDELVVDKKKKVLRILTMDGGGIRGVGVATILEEIENVTKKKIYELFDVIVGTSAGGMNALMLTIPDKDRKIMSAKELKELYFEKKHEIFMKNPSYKYHPFSNTKYKGEGLERLVEERFPNEIRLASSLIPVGVVTTDYHLHKPLLMCVKSVPTTKHIYPLYLKLNKIWIKDYPMENELSYSMVKPFKVI